MVKVCAVRGCPSGRKKKNRKNATPQSVSYFRPSNPARLQTWKKSLGIELKSTDYVCHLHFKEEHIKMYETMQIQGEVKILPLGKISLRDNIAVPTIEHQFIPPPLKALKINTIDIDNSQKSDTRHDHLYSRDGQQAQQEKCEELEIEIKAEYDNLSDNEHSNNLDESSLNQTACSDSLNQSIKEFRDNIKKLSILPPCWMYVEAPNGLEFMRMDPITRQIKNHICLNEDLSVTVVLANSEEVHLNEKITSFENTYDYLKSVERWPSCVGTQFSHNKYSKNCKGVIIAEDNYQRNGQNPRCIACQVLRNRIQSQLTSKKQMPLKKDIHEVWLCDAKVKQGIRLKQVTKAEAERAMKKYMRGDITMYEERLKNL